MGGKRTTKEELARIESLTLKGSTTKEIAQKLGRSEAAIRNLRYKKHLAARAQDDIRTSSMEKDRLSIEVKQLQEKKKQLESEIFSLEWRQFKLEMADPERSKSMSFFRPGQEQISSGKDKTSSILNL